MNKSEYFNRLQLVFIGSMTGVLFEALTQWGVWTIYFLLAATAICLYLEHRFKGKAND